MEKFNSQRLHEKATLDVPNEITESILARLPVKSLLRFQAVSETWEAIISDPVFTQIHLQQSKSSACQCIFTEVDTPRIFKKFRLAEIKNQELQVKSLLKNPHELGDALFMYYLDGLLLFRCYKDYYPKNYKYPDPKDYCKQLYALWNPSTATFIMFRCLYSHRKDLEYYGLCYDPLVQDYKVVMGHKSHYAVFHCRNKSWTEKKKFPMNGISSGWSPGGVYSNGSLYWLMHKYSTRNGELHLSKYKIVRFDSRDDEFKKVETPKEMTDIHAPFDLVQLGGDLCLYCWSSHHLFIIKEDDDGDWAVFIAIDLEPSMNSLSPRPIFLTDENEIILETSVSSEYFLAYNPCEKTFTKITKNLLNMRSIVFQFVESLVLGTGRCRHFRRRRAFDELGEVFFLM